MTNKLPVFITKDIVPFPKQIITMEVGRQISIETINLAIDKYNSEILLTIQKDQQKNLTKTNINNFGVVGKVVSFEETPSQTMELTVEVFDRVSFKNLSKTENIFFSEFKIIEEIEESSEENIELLENLNLLILEDEIIKIKEEDKKNLQSALSSSSLVQYIDFLSSIVPLELSKRVELLKETKLTNRIKILNNVLTEKKQLIEEKQNENPYIEKATKDEIADKVRSKLSKQQREFYLREQLKAIKEELNEISGEESEIEQLRKRINQNPYPEHIKVKLFAELKRLESMPSINAESNIIRNYIDWLMDIPYWQHTDEVVDIKNSQKILDKHHFGLEKPKKRIIEFLAQKAKNSEAKPTIICFIGPPGTGKTTLSKSIAEALNRKFAKISLGGVKDESEIRGHRKTYIASAPGKIVQTMKKVGVNNPLILLDEIDKMSSDYKGDPSSAMLEVLDYEQNNQFQDHFIEEDYDLSNVMFIATANSYEDIPSALYDRLEFIQLSSYTELEKLEIAKNHLIPKVLKETNIDKKYIDANDETILYLIRHYTREAGVRQLYRTLLSVSRKIIVKELTNKRSLSKFKLNPKTIVELLGKEIFDFTRKNEKKEIGVVTGLAWTSVGGDILPIEVTFYPGKGNLVLTGQQRDVMKESANIALGFVKANYEKFDIKPNIMVDKVEKNLFKDFDVHLHVPDGATPKDGPSAGITFTTALVSAFSQKPVSKEFGMTGEITLHGKVFPIGGLREKSISAYRSGLKTILIPKKNLKDLEDIPEEVKQNLQIIPVEKYEDVYKIIFG